MLTECFELNMQKQVSRKRPMSGVQQMNRVKNICNEIGK